MYSPIAIANYFIQKSFSDGTELTPMKLVKLVYIAHGWYLALSGGKPLLNEAVQAWKYGPVIPTVYHTYKKYLNSQITSMESENLFSNSYPMVDDKDIIEFLDKIWEVYRGYSGLQLSTLTHQDSTPWDKIWNKNNGHKEKSVVIPNDLIQEYYTARIKKRVETAQ